MKRNSAGIWVPKTPGKEIAKDYNSLRPEDSDSLKEAKVESWIAKTLGERLCSLYPNRGWAVKVDLRGRMVVVMCPDVSMRYGYYLHMKNRTIQQLADEMSRVGGEVLERARISRNRKFNEDILETIPRDLRETVIGLDHS